MRDQASVFDRCCSVFAPRYRQASLRAIGHSDAAADLAYTDVDAAFTTFLEQTHGAPIVIAGHSQGAGLAWRLIQQRIAPDPALRARLVVAILPGSFIPAHPTAIPACATPGATGCVVSWNTSSPADHGAGARMVTQDARYWRDAAWQDSGTEPPLCVDPLDWKINGAAPAQADLGSLPLDPPGAATVPHLTGAACRDGALIVSLPADAPGFHNWLAFLTGSQHLLDINLFWSNIRQNLDERIAAFSRSRRSEPSPRHARAR